MYRSFLLLIWLCLLTVNAHAEDVSCSNLGSSYTCTATADTCDSAEASALKGALKELNPSNIEVKEETDYGMETQNIVTRKSEGKICRQVIERKEENKGCRVKLRAFLPTTKGGCDAEKAKVESSKGRFLNDRFTGWKQAIARHIFNRSLEQASIDWEVDKRGNSRLIAEVSINENLENTLNKMLHGSERGIGDLAKGISLFFLAPNESGYENALRFIRAKQSREKNLEDLEELDVLHAAELYFDSTIANSTSPRVSSLARLFLAKTYVQIAQIADEKRGSDAKDSQKKARKLLVQVATGLDEEDERDLLECLSGERDKSAGSKIKISACSLTKEQLTEIKSKGDAWAQIILAKAFVKEGYGYKWDSSQAKQWYEIALEKLEKEKDGFLQQVAELALINLIKEDCIQEGCPRLEKLINLDSNIKSDVAKYGSFKYHKVPWSLGSAYLLGGRGAGQNYKKAARKFEESENWGKYDLAQMHLLGLVDGRRSADPVSPMDALEKARDLMWESCEDFNLRCRAFELYESSEGYLDSVLKNEPYEPYRHGADLPKMAKNMQKYLERYLLDSNSYPDYSTTEKMYERIEYWYRTSCKLGPEQCAKGLDDWLEVDLFEYRFTGKYGFPKNPHKAIELFLEEIQSYFEACRKGIVKDCNAARRFNGLGSLIDEHDDHFGLTEIFALKSKLFASLGSEFTGQEIAFFAYFNASSAYVRDCEHRKSISSCKKSARSLEDACSIFKKGSAISSKWQGKVVNEIREAISEIKEVAGGIKGTSDRNLKYINDSLKKCNGL